MIKKWIFWTSNSIYKISLVKESFSQVGVFKIQYTFSRKIQFNCLYLKNWRKKILNFNPLLNILTLEIIFQIIGNILWKRISNQWFWFLFITRSKINFLKLFRAYVNNCSCIIKEIFYIHFLNNETSSFKKCFMSDLFFFNLFLAVLWLQPSPPPFRYTRTYMKTCKIKIKFSNLIFSKTKLQMKKNSKFNFRIISPFVESSPFFFSFFQSYYNYKDHPSQMKPGEISRIKFNFLFENQIKKKKKNIVLHFRLT